MYAYYFLCQRKLWFFANNLNMEDQHENVLMGKLIDESSYKRETKHVLLDGVASIDFIKNDIVYEVKKSDAALEMAINQVKYYIFLLRQKGSEIHTGIISIPTKKITEKVEYISQDDQEIKNNLVCIREIIDDIHIPPMKYMSACKQCAYYELCFI